MKGIVFTEFMDMVDDKFGMDVTETIVQASDLPSGGAYTAVGTYDHAEIVSLVVNLSKSTNIEVPVLIYLGQCGWLYPYGSSKALPRRCTAADQD